MGEVPLLESQQAAAPVYLLLSIAASLTASFYFWGFPEKRSSKARRKHGLGVVAVGRVWVRNKEEVARLCGV